MTPEKTWNKRFTDRTETLFMKTLHSIISSLKLTRICTFLFTIPIILSASLLTAHETGEILHFQRAPFLIFESSTETAHQINGALIYESPVSSISTEPFNRILINGVVPDGILRLQFSCEETPGTWSRWMDSPLHIFEHGRFWAKLELEQTFSRRLKLRFISESSKQKSNIEVFAVEVLNDQPSPEQKPVVTSRSQKKRLFHGDTVPKPDIISREDWGAQPPVGEYVPHDPYRLTQHHTAGRRIYTLEDGKAEMRFIQDFHQNGRGWQDIGYHFCMDDAGRIYEGTPMEYRGTHTGGNNTGNLGISLFGNYHEPDQSPSRAALDSLVSIWSWLAFYYEINPDTLYGHRDYGSGTACPGDNFYVEIPELRSSIRHTLGFGSPYIALPEPQPFSMEISPDSGISFFIRDDEEGVDISSIKVRVNHEEINPEISGDSAQYAITYQPATPFPSSQNVIIEVEAYDLGSPPKTMTYTYSFTIEVQALHLEVESGTDMRNASMEITGNWSSDSQDAAISGLSDGIRLFTQDTDGSHRIRVYPAVLAEGDYRVLMAVRGQYLGESAYYRFVNASGLEHSRVIEYNKLYDQKWSNLSPTPIHFDTGGLLGAYVELSGLADLDTRLILDALRLERVDKLDPPATPTLKWARITMRRLRDGEQAGSPSDSEPVTVCYSDSGERNMDRPVLQDIRSRESHHSGDSARLHQVVNHDNNMEINGSLLDPTISALHMVNQVDVAWYPNLAGDIQGYRLFVSGNGTTWGGPLVDETRLTANITHCTITYSGTTGKLYFRLIAVDQNGVESDEGVFEPFLSTPSDTYGVGFDNEKRVLIVDNFDRLGSWSQPYHPFVRSYGEAVKASGIGFDSCTETAVQTGEVTLENYDAVFYFCGDDSRSDESIAAADQFRMLSYLQNGGKLFISGSEIGYDFHATTSEELARTNSLLKATYSGDLAGSNRILGTVGTAFEGLNFVFGTLNSEDTYIEDYPDYIQPYGGSQTALKYENGRNAAVCYTGPFGTGNPDAQLVFLAFTFETINQPQDRADLMKSVLQYFGFETGG